MTTLSFPDSLPQSLPQSLRDISEMIGIEKTLEIVQSHGGQRLWIPRQLTLDWRLLPLLGYDAAHKLISLCGGSQIEIPLCRALEREARNRQICNDRQTLTIGELSAKYNLERSQIKRIVRGTYGTKSSRVELG